MSNTKKLKIKHAVDGSRQRPVLTLENSFENSIMRLKKELGDEPLPILNLEAQKTPVNLRQNRSSAANMF
jgi:hypothetical protein